MLAEDDIAAAAGVVLVHTQIATFPPTLVIRTVASDFILGVGCVGGTVLGTLVITRLRSGYWLASVAGGVQSITILVNLIVCTIVPRSDAAEGGTVAGQGDVAAGAGVVRPCAHVATFVLSVRVTLHCGPIT